MASGRAAGHLDMRCRIVEAAIEAVAAEGTSVSTAVVAKRSGVAQGSIFHHFATKAGLLNAVYVSLAQELRATAVDGLDVGLGLEEKLLEIWNRWIDWGTVNPQRRHALLSIGSSDYLSPETRAAVAERNEPGIEIFLQATSTGALRDQPIQFIGVLVEAVVNATIDMMISEPDAAIRYREAGFDALRSMLA